MIHGEGLWNGVGWAASVVLVATIVYQVTRQWRTGHSEGVSRWLYVGQCFASTGFLAYSLHLGDAVFVATNGVLLLSATVGLLIILRQRHREGTEPPSARSELRPHGIRRQKGVRP